MRENDLFSVLAVIVGGFIVLGLPILYSTSHELGEQLLQGDTSYVPPVIAAVSGLWLFVAVFSVAEALGEGGKPEFEACELVIRPPKDVALGLVLHEAIWVGALLTLPVLVAFSGLSMGLGTPVPFIGGIIGIILLLGTAHLVGFTVGFWVRGVTRRSTLLSRWRAVVGTVFGIGVLLLIFSGRFVPVMVNVGTYLADSPIGWFGHVMLATTPAAGQELERIAGAVVVSFLVVGTCSNLLVRGAVFAWYGEPPVVHRPASSRVNRGREQLDLTLRTIGVNQITSAIAITALTRAARAPLQLLYLLVPLVLILPVLDAVLNDGALPRYTVWIVMLYGGWAAGVVFPLNILGMITPVLPSVLTSRARAPQIVRGHILAGWLLVFVPGVVLTLAVAAVTGYATWHVLLLGVLSPVIAFLGAMVAAGCGAAFPRTSPVQRETHSYPPSMVAFTIFSMGFSLMILAVGIVLDDMIVMITQHVISTYIPLQVNVGETMLRAGAYFIILSFVFVSIVSYRYSISRIEAARSG